MYVTLHMVLHSSQLLESVDEFIVVLCHHLTLNFSRNDGQQVKEILKESLPKMSCRMLFIVQVIFVFTIIFYQH